MAGASKKAERSKAWPYRWLLWLLISCAPFLAAQNTDAGDASVHGVVRDAQGSPMVGVQLLLQKKSDPKGLTITTDSYGNYAFTHLTAGEYSLHPTVGASAETGTDALILGAHESKTYDMALKNDSTIPQFFDHPQFTVSGVVDTTALGGHGSDTVVRTRESIAKDTAKLNKADTAEPGVPPDLQDLVRAGKYSEAKDKVRALIASSDKAELHHLLADIDEKAGDPLNAVHEYQRAAELSPSEPYLFDWGSELLLHHAPEPAQQVFAKGTRLFPRSQRMLVGLGAAYFASGLYDDAVQKVCQASDLNPAEPTPYLFLGKMQSAENVSSPQLLEHLHRFATTQPQNAMANYYYAVALWKQNRANKASDSEIESLLTNAIRLEPNFASAELQLGILKSERGDTAAAIPHLTRAIQIDPQSQEAHFRLSQAYRKLGDAENSKQELQTYKELSQKSAEQIDRERREIPQFVYTLRGPSPASAP